MLARPMVSSEMGASPVSSPDVLAVPEAQAAAIAINNPSDTSVAVITLALPIA
jgi:hypothetical protein